MSGFSKLHSSLTASSLWNEPDKTRIVFITMLSMANSDGDVKASVVGLAHQARESLADTEKALETLLAPDPHSGRKELEGRRIVPIDGGWHLVTHQFYRELGMSEETKRYWRDKKRAQRNKSKTVRDKSRQSRKVKESIGSLASVSVIVSASSWIEEKRREYRERGFGGFDDELEKAKKWCGNKGRKFTKRFFTKWLERADMPIIATESTRPSIPDLPDPPKLTDEQIAQNRERVKSLTSDLRKKLKMPVS